MLCLGGLLLGDADVGQRGDFFWRFRFSTAYFGTLPVYTVFVADEDGGTFAHPRGDVGITCDLPSRSQKLAVAPLSAGLPIICALAQS